MQHDHAPNMHVSPPAVPSSESTSALESELKKLDDLRVVISNCESTDLAKLRADVALLQDQLAHSTSLSSSSDQDPYVLDLTEQLNRSARRLNKREKELQDARAILESKSEDIQRKLYSARQDAAAAVTRQRPLPTLGFSSTLPSSLPSAAPLSFAPSSTLGYTRRESRAGEVDRFYQPASLSPKFREVRARRERSPPVAYFNISKEE